MNRIAIISDVHGNLEALKTVLSDIKERNIDQIICLGDTVAKGTHSNECVNLIKENCSVVIGGNTDERFSKELNLEDFPELEQKRIKWNRSRLSEENKTYLRSLPFCYEFYMSGSLVRVFHATPRKNNEAVTNLDSPALKSTLFDPSPNTSSQLPADIVLYGHIHHQYLDKLYNKTLINVGSVGNPFDVIRNPNFDSDKRETTNAHYVIIEGNFGQKERSSISFQFVRIPYDIKKELEDIEENLEPDAYRYEIEEGLYRDYSRLEENFKKSGIVFRK